MDCQSFFPIEGYWVGATSHREHKSHPKPSVNVVTIKGSRPDGPNFDNFPSSSLSTQDSGHRLNLLLRLSVDEFHSKGNV